MQHKPLRRLLSSIVAVAVAVNGLAISPLAGNNTPLDFTKVSNKNVSANIGRKPFEEKEQKPAYGANDVVRVSIFLKDKSTIEAGFEVKDIAENTEAIRYRDSLQSKQDAVVTEIEKVTNKELDVVWNLTLAANLISANVEYGQISKIEKISDVRKVVVETQYEPAVLKQSQANDPNMATSSAQIGSSLAWAAGYTGAGSRVAIIDTGTDDDHQSFSEAGYLYSLGKLAEKEGKSVDAYIAGLDLLTADKVAEVADQLNVKIDPAKTYLSAKLPFAYNYIDGDYAINHDGDAAGEHGSHVAGIATANSYIKGEDGSFVPALSSVFVQGVAPDAQLITMKVFGKGGGAYDSDYMAAIEDAIVLNADSVNLSLGSANPGMARADEAEYQEIMDNLVECGVVVSISAGNADAWAKESDPGDLYSDDVSFHTGGSPGSFTNALTVASIDNAGSTGDYFTVGDNMIFYSDSSTEYGANAFKTLSGEYEYVLIDGFGTPEEWAALGEGALEGKIAVCSRGTSSFFEKANAAVEAGAIATIIYNNTTGVIGLNLTGYKYKAPCISILQSEGKLLKDNATAVEVDPAAANAAPAADETVSEAEEEVPAADESSEAEEEAAVVNDIFDTEDEAPAEDENGAEDEAAPEETDPEAEDEDTDAEEEAPAEAPAEADDEEAPAQNDTQAAEDEKVTYYLGTLTVGNGIGSALSKDEFYTMSDFSSWGVPGTLQMKPEITAPGGGIYSVNGAIAGGKEYEVMSGTSMAAPQIAGIAAVAAQYVREKGLADKTGEDERTLIQSLIMSTAEPVLESEGVYYSVLKQGAGLANIGNVVNADSYILMGADATGSYKDGKVKVELGDDPDKNGEYSFSFSVNNLTAEEKTYDLSAILFTQAIEGDFLSQTTTSLASQAAFSGTGVSGNTVTVGANGTAQVNVTLTLSADAVSALEEYVNGAYIEGYVFVKPSGADANKRVTHSIPVLGFYGNWSDPSMFEVGSYVEYYLTGEEDRDPYLGDDLVNLFTFIDADDKGEYILGGNPYDEYEEYIPERNALNAEDIIIANFALIRNAADSRLAVYGEDGLLASANKGAIDSAFYHTNNGAWMYTSDKFRAGTVLGTVAEDTATELAFEAALEYYVDDDGNVAWDKLGKGAALTIPAVVDNTAPTVLSVEINKESNKLIVTVQDNQYVAAIGLFDRTGSQVLAVDYADLDAKKGAETVYELSLDGVQGKKFMIQAFDYAMNTVTYELKHQIGEDVPLPEMIAFNLLGHAISDDGNDYWVGLSETTDFLELYFGSPYTTTDLVFDAATIADHIVFASTNSGDHSELYVMPEYDLTDMTKVCDLAITIGDETIPVRLQDMAYNYVDGNVYAMLNGILLTVDKLTGELEIVGEVPFDSNTLACDKEGNFYCNEFGTGDVYKFTLDSADEEGVFDAELLCTYEDFESSYLQAMEVNPDTGILWWTACSEDSSPFIKIDPTTGDLTVLDEDLVFELNALIIPETSDASYDFNDDGLVDENDVQALLDYRTGVISKITNEENADFDGNGVIDTYDVYLFLKKLWTVPVKDVTGIQIDTEATLTIGFNYELSAVIQPWTAADKSVTWTSSDESVATVDKNGVITAVSAGECTITAVPNANKSISATCHVTVEAVDVTFNGILMDTDNTAKFFNWNMKNEATWTAGKALPVEVISAAYDDYYDELYVVDFDGNMHIFDSTASTYYGSMALGNFAFDDMTISDIFGPVGVSGRNLLFFGEEGLDGYTLKTENYGASQLVAIANMGLTRINVGTVIYANEIALLDNAGNIWIFFLGQDGGLYNTSKYVGSSGVKEAFTGVSGYPLCSMVCADDGEYYTTQLYLSVYNEEDDTCRIYCIDVDDDAVEGSAGLIGDVGAGVWPTAFLSATVGTDAAAASMFTSLRPIEAVEADAAKLETVEIDMSELKAEIRTASDVDAAASEVMAVSETDSAISVTKADAAAIIKAADKASYDFGALDINVSEIKAAKTASYNGVNTAAGRADNEGEVDETIVIPEGQPLTQVDIPAGIDADGESTPVTNGLAIITYDPSIVTFEDVTNVPTDYYSVNVNEEDGIILLGYVSAEVIPETEEITLSFVTEEMAAGDTAPISVGYVELANGEETDETGAPVYMNLLLEVKDSDGNPVNSLGDFIKNAAQVEEVLSNPDMPKADVAIEVPEAPDEPIVITPPSSDNTPSDDKIVLEDEDTGVKVEVGNGGVDSGAELVVEETGRDDNSVSIDISVVVDGVEVQPNGTMVVTIPVPDGLNGDDCHVYRVEADGTYTDMNAVYANGVLTFTTDRLGEFVVSTVKPGTTDPADTNKPAESEPAGTNPPDVSIGGDGNNGGDTNEPGNNGGDNIPNTGVVIFAAPAAISALAVVAAKKRRK